MSHLISSAFTDRILPKERGIVCLIGAGGKTSLMFLLAKEIQSLGQKVLTTTSTKIFYPGLRQSRFVYSTRQPLEWLKKMDKAHGLPQHLTLAFGPAQPNKLQGFAPETIDEIQETGFYDWILVEADGAAGRPLKAPAEHEPVIPKQTRTSIAVLGLLGFKRSLDGQWFFRLKEFTALTGRKPGERILMKDLVKLLIHQRGLFKNTPSGAEKVLYLNQADNLSLLGLGKMFSRLIQKQAPDFLSRSTIGTTRYKKIL